MPWECGINPELLLPLAHSREEERNTKFWSFAPADYLCGESAACDSGTREISSSPRVRGKRWDYFKDWIWKYRNQLVSSWFLFLMSHLHSSSPLHTRVRPSWRRSCPWQQPLPPDEMAGSLRADSSFSSLSTAGHRRGRQRSVWCHRWFRSLLQIPVCSVCRSCHTILWA